MGWASRANPRTAWDEAAWTAYRAQQKALEDASRAQEATRPGSLWQRFVAWLKGLARR